MTLHSAAQIFPKLRRMFWSNQGRRRIERASMDGRSRIVLHTNVGSSIVGLTLDYDTQTLYWVDSGFRTLESSGVDGSNRVLLTSLPPSSVPWDVTFFGGTLYWTDWGLDVVYSSPLESPGNFSIVVPFITQPGQSEPSGIKVISERRQMEG